MNTQEYLIGVLIEELIETAHQANKLNRFGPNEVQPGYEKTNIERLSEEYSHIIAAVEMLDVQGIVIEVSQRAIDEKKLAVRKYMRLSRDLGTLQ